MTSFDAISDLHGNLPEEVGMGDVLFVVGDFTPVKDHSHWHQMWWAENVLAPWLANLPYDEIIACAGNHDFLAQTKDGHELLKSLPWTYLLDETVERHGHVIHGSPWTPTFGSWAFMRKDEDLTDVWAKIPDETTILLTHGPPHGKGDLVERGEYVGSQTLAARTAELDLTYHLCGHIHEARGQYGNVWNVSHVNLAYEPVHEVVGLA